MQYVSKGVIIGPILILALSLIFYFPRKNLQSRVFKPSPTPTIGVENIDLSGEYVCGSKNLQAYIKSGKIFIKYQGGDLNYYLYADDCLYTWEDRKYSGKKTCGLSGYISLFENLSRLKLLNFETLISSALPIETKDETAKEIAKALQSCSKGKVENTKIFEVPQNVLFKNTEMPWLRPTFPTR